MSGETPKDGAASVQARLILAVLFAVSILNFVDRQILAILAGKVKGDLLISDAELPVFLVHLLLEKINELSAALKHGCGLGRPWPVLAGHSRT